MKISYGQQIKIEEIKGIKIRLFLFAGNHETRALEAYKKITTCNTIVKCVALCYNETFCIPETCKADKIVIGSHIDIYKILEMALAESKGEELNILVDYSCMTKSWYYSIILYLTNKKLILDKLTLYFIYTPSKYSEPLDPKPNTEIGPLPGKYIVPTDKPKALIVCLGYEKSKAEGIIEHLDPKVYYLFYTNPALDPKFVITLEKNNKAILAERPFKVIKYPFDDLLYLERELTSIYHLLKNDYSIIIAPLGPKPFTLIAMLMSVKYPDIDIWRVGSGSDINEYEREPIEGDQYIINKVVLE